MMNVFVITSRYEIVVGSNVRCNFSLIGGLATIEIVATSYVLEDGAGSDADLAAFKVLYCEYLEAKKEGDAKKVGLLESKLDELPLYNAHDLRLKLENIPLQSALNEDGWHAKDLFWQTAGEPDGVPYGCFYMNEHSGIDQVRLCLSKTPMGNKLVVRIFAFVAEYMGVFTEAITDWNEAQ